MEKHLNITIQAGDFKAKCLHIMDDVSKSRRPVIITKRGKPLVKLIPFTEEKLVLFGKLKGSMTISDITQPIDDKWDANE